MEKETFVQQRDSQATIAADENENRQLENGVDQLSARQRLNPQPSDDPDDPLNWPLSLKVY